MIKINGERWRVLNVSPTHPSLYTGDHYALGMCNDRTKTVYINRDLNNHYYKKVLAHELTHAAMFSYNVYLDYYQEEVVADIIATYGQEIVEMTNMLFYRLKKV